MKYIGNLNTHRGLIGKIGEDFASEYLQSIGHYILERNRRTKYGEIDIISLYKNTLHFVEVKTSMSVNVTAEAHLDSRKMKKMANLAGLYYKDYENKREDDLGKLGKKIDEKNETQLSLDFIGVYLNYDKSLKKVVYLESLEV